MQFPVLIERVENNGFRASSGAPLELVADGATRFDAIQNLQSKLSERMQNGAEFTVLDITVNPANDNPWVKYAGMFKDDPEFQDVMDIIAENRRKMDEDPEVP